MKEMNLGWGFSIEIFWRIMNWVCVWYVKVGDYWLKGWEVWKVVLNWFGWVELSWVELRWVDLVNDMKIYCWWIKGS
jgi:hypothetical protein